MPHVDDALKRGGFAHVHGVGDAPLPHQEEAAGFNSYAYWKQPEPGFDLDKVHPLSLPPAALARLLEAGKKPCRVGSGRRCMGTRLALLCLPPRASRRCQHRASPRKRPRLRLRQGALKQSQQQYL